MRSFFWFFRLSKKIHTQIMFEPIVNWGIVKKSALMLIIGFGLNLEWFIWKISLYLRPEHWQWINLKILPQQIFLNFIILILFVLAFLYCLYFKNTEKHQYAIPIFTSILLNVSICIESLLIGALSPANMMTYISLTNIILIIFPRRYVYFFLVPSSLFYVACCYLTLHHHIEYDYLFKISSTRFANSFWLSSMILLISPVLLFAITFTELLLNQWRNRERLIQQMTLRDPLTNIGNRRAIDYEYEQLEKKKHGYSIILVDLDFFKKINDQYGHDTGDRVLIHVAQLLQRKIQIQDVVARLGGEEFILILENQTLVQAQQVAENCRLAIESCQLIGKDGEKIKFTASFGVATHSAQLRPQEVLHQADKALYVAKNSGRNQVQVLT